MNKIILLFLITVSIFAKDANIKKEKIEKKDSIMSEELLKTKTKDLKVNDEILKYISIEGYFRTGMNYRNNYDLNSFSLTNNDSVVGSSKHKPTIDEFKEGKSSSRSTVSYNTRFRFSPNIVVGEYLRAVATIDIFDNKLYGDNTESLLFAKEAYFEGTTPLGKFYVGRMATDWGLGMYRNSGKGKFSNYGTYIDQVQFEVRDVLSFIPFLSFKLAYEVKDSSAKDTNLYSDSQSINYDIEDEDDYVGFSLYIQSKIDGEELDAYLLENSMRLNYGLFLARSWKNKTTTINLNKTDENSSKLSYEDSSLDYYTVDAFFEFYHKKDFTVKGEVIYLFGENEENKSFSQWGAALKTNAHFLMNTLSIGLDAGIASGESSDDRDAYTINASKSKMNDFTFNLDFDVDLIFFKEIHSLSSLYYIRPHVKWLATKNISLELWAITSMALNESQTYGRDKYLGTEIDMSLEYLNRDGLNFGLRTGVYVPGKGMDYLGTDGKRTSTSSADDLTSDFAAELAYTIQLFLIMKF